MRKFILSPSILAADYLNMQSQLDDIRAGGAEYVHIDVMDGEFVRSISLGIPVIDSLRSGSNLVFDVHLMINEPIRYVSEFSKSADIVTVHLESCSDTENTLKAYRAHGVKTGLSIKPNTPVCKIYPYLELIDMALIMTVEPGFGGQKLIEDTLLKVSELKKYCEDNGYDIDIEVDGGIKLDNCEKVIKSGANVVVAGTAVFKGDVIDNTKKFMEIGNSLI